MGLTSWWRARRALNRARDARLARVDTELAATERSARLEASGWDDEACDRLLRWIHAEEADDLEDLDANLGRKHPPTS